MCQLLIDQWLLLHYITVQTVVNFESMLADGLD